MGVLEKSPDLWRLLAFGNLVHRVIGMPMQEGCFFLVPQFPEIKLVNGPDLMPGTSMLADLPFSDKVTLFTTRVV